MAPINSPIQYQLTNPYLLSTQLDIDETVRLRMVEQILGQRDIADYHGGYTFEVLDNKMNRDFSTLYNKFLELAKEVFGPFTLSTKHKHWCWANVYNKDTFRTNMHTHELTSTINAIFYLNIPQTDEPTGSGLMVGYDGAEHIFLPDNCDLVMMPSWMGHGPIAHSSDENRISINMEICTTEDVHELYTLEKIYKNCTVKME